MANSGDGAGGGKMTMGTGVSEIGKGREVLGVAGSGDWAEETVSGWKEAGGLDPK